MAPSKDLDRPSQILFKQLLSNYEQKEYKKGIKAADTILKKYPTHGETMAMKGLILTNIDKKEEGWESVRKGLRNDLKSHICWHVYGLLYRADRNYEESMKCYVNALKFDADNLVVLRDLAVIQSQLGLYEQLIASRLSLLLRQPDQRGNHTALAVAYHLNKDYSNAEKVLQGYEDERLPIKPKHNSEHSMTTLYHNTVIADSGDFERALSHLETNELYILDKLEVLERKAKYHTSLKNTGAAQTLYERLLDINPDCNRYYSGLEDSDAVYAALQQKYPKSSAARRRPLNWLSGDDFRQAVDKYLRNLLQKGVPSTFVDIKALYVDDQKADIIESVVEDYYKSLQVMNGHGPEPTSKLWTMYFLAQHYDHRRQLERAMSLIDEAIAHTPTLVELHLIRARILKHTGSEHLAAEEMNIARELDLQDRFINTKCTKYYLRADQNGEAIQTVSMFLNSTLGGGSIGDLQEMQSVNLLVEDGFSYLRQNFLGLALKRFEAVKKGVDQWYEDCFDFHQYCFRKGTICAYIDALEWHSHIYGHPIYQRAVSGAVQALLMLHHRPELKNGPLEVSTLSDAEKKKEKKRLQKIRARCAKDATREAEKKDGVDMHRKIDLDPVGDKLAATPNPLENALDYIRPWLRQEPDSKAAGLLACQIYLEKGDIPNALSRLESLDSHYLAYRFQHITKGMDLTAPLKSRVEEYISKQFQNRSLKEWNRENTPEAIFGATAIDYLKVAIEEKDDAFVDEISAMIDLQKTSLSDARALHDVLETAASSASAAAFNER